MGRWPRDGQAAALAGQMKIQWTSKASSDLVRLHEHLSSVAPEAAARVVQQLAHAPDRLLDYPRIGEKLEAYEPREVRRIRPEERRVGTECVSTLRSRWSPSRTNKNKNTHP